MSLLNLAEHVRYCEVGGERIFLNLLEDRYFKPPAAADAAFSALSLAPGAAAHPDADALLAAGLLVEGPVGRPLSPTRHAAPTSSFVEQGSAVRGFSARTIAEVAILVHRARRAVRSKRVAHLLAGGAGSAGFAGKQSPDRRDDAVGDFLQARRLVPWPPNCLSDSLALRRYLERRSIGVDLVIGAKLHPFGAHCWLQDGTTVLNDSLASAREFAPILVA